MAEEDTKDESTPKGKDPKDMGWHEWLDFKVTKLDYVDVKLIGNIGLLFGLVIGAHFPGYITPYWIPIVVLALLCYIRPLKHMFG
ncbi:MAG: hypothetical protein QF415_02770 [Candidatus Undinarchaeales archaeon]|jgi:hypothetical protein|nr:hypothetical protein [Candidatus Undinarchaeales archaeon]MDP7492747.1 hypothetical protein [Candidatus Undinarchaeales archaeon]